MVTLLRAGPGAEVVDELVAVRSCVHACTDRRPMREVGSLGRTRSDCISIVCIEGFLSCSTDTFESSKARARALTLARRNGGAKLGLPRPVFVVSLAASYTDILVAYHL